MHHAVDTCRYTPLLAYLLVPNLTLHIAWGKVLFALADIAAALLIWKRVVQKSIAAGYAASQVDHLSAIALSIWLLNPYTATISTRGNGDSLVVLQQHFVLILLQHSVTQSQPGDRGNSGKRNLLDDAPELLFVPFDPTTRAASSQRMFA